MSNYRVTISLDSEQDRDLVAWLERQENRSEAVRRALRAYIATPTLSDVYRQNERLAQLLGNLDALESVLARLEAIEDRLDRGVTVGGCGEANEPEEPELALSALDSLVDIA